MTTHPTVTMHETAAALPGALGTPLRDRALLTGQQAAEVAALFKVLASGSRLQILLLLAARGETKVGDLADAARMSPQAVSNQLQHLTGQRICASRRAGTAIYYRITDPCVRSLLHYGVCMVRQPCESAGR